MFHRFAKLVVGALHHAQSFQQRNAIRFFLRQIALARSAFEHLPHQCQRFCRLSFRLKQDYIVEADIEICAVKLSCLGGKIPRFHIILFLAVNL